MHHLRDILVVLLICAASFAPANLVAQTRETVQSPVVRPAADAAEPEGAPGGGDDFFMSPDHRAQIYEESKLSYGKAALYTLVFPGLGNIYTEQYFMAGLEFSLMAFTLVFVGYALTTRQPEFYGWGAVTGGLAYTSGIVSSMIGVHQYNTLLRRNLKVGEYARGPAPGLHLTFSF